MSISLQYSVLYPLHNFHYENGQIENIIAFWDIATCTLVKVVWRLT